MAHDAYELSVFFSSTDMMLREKVLLELCKRDPDYLLELIREAAMPPGVDMDELRTLMRAGKKINAIKAYRAMAPGVGIREAKDFVEALRLYPNSNHVSNIP